MNSDELKGLSKVQILFGYFKENAQTRFDPLTQKNRHSIKMPNSETIVYDDDSLNLFEKFIESIQQS